MQIESLSVSKIKSCKLCEFKFYLEYYLKLEIKKSFAADQGTLIHNILEHFGQAKKIGLKNPTIKRKWINLILRKYRKGLWILSKKAIERKKDCKNCQYYQGENCFISGQQIETFIGCPKNEFEESISLVEVIINDNSYNNPLNKKIINVENKFEINVGEFNIPIRGIIDLAVELDKDTLEIIDYKTGSFIQTSEECEHDPQLLIYHLAAKKIYPQYKNILMTIYYLRSNPITLAFSNKDEKLTENAINHYWYSIKNNKFPQRRCDKPNGKVQFDWQCKALCNPELCKIEREKFIQLGGIINE